MICEHCGMTAPKGANICENCGSILPVQEMGRGAASFRQGRKPKPEKEIRRGSYEDDHLDDDSFYLKEKVFAEQCQRVQEYTKELQSRKKFKTKNGYKHLINWAKVYVYSFLIILVLIVSGYLFLETTDQGQYILAKLGHESNATAMWKLAEDRLNEGYIEQAILLCEQAMEKEPKIEGLYEYALLQGEAYEAGNRVKDAEGVYELLYTKVDKKRTEAYSNNIRIMLTESRKAEAADLLKVAYDNTKDIAFKIQRNEIVPIPPIFSKEGGRYELAQELTLTSTEGHEVWYIIGNEGNLPEDGTLFKEPIVLEEGGWTVRAISVSTDMVSDEASLRYIVSLPVPDAPKSSLQPGKYEQRQRVRLRNVGDDPDVTFYYTIDSTMPDRNSPIYDPEKGILLPGGRVFVKAVAVNKYGKVSNEMSVEYMVNISFKKYYRGSDTFKGFSLMETSKDQFVQKFGNPTEEKDIGVDPAIRGKCIELLYPWGYARFYYTQSGPVLYHISTTDSSVTAPRSTKIGNSEKKIVDKFRDMGQAENQDGSRDLYFDSKEGCFGKVSIIDENNKRIDYIYNDTAKSAVITMTYFLKDDKVIRMEHSYHIEQ